MSKKERDKGARGEREVAALFQDAGWTQARRELAQYQKKLGRDLQGTAPYCVQCKNDKRPNPIRAFREAESSIDGMYAYPIAFVKEGGRWLVTLDASLFFRLITGFGLFRGGE